MTSEPVPVADTVREYVYGWGRTKHIKDPAVKWPKGLCGAGGGNQYAERQRGHRMPVCKHCLGPRWSSRVIDGRGLGRVVERRPW
jgi:hypothetical protein